MTLASQTNSVAYWASAGRLNRDASFTFDGTDLTTPNLVVTGNTNLGNATSDTIGMYGSTGVDQAAALTAASTTITAAGSASDFALQASVSSGAGNAFGFVTAAECDTLMNVVLNNQLRINELEAALNDATGVGITA